MEEEENPLYEKMIYFLWYYDIERIQKNKKSKQRLNVISIPGEMENLDALLYIEETTPTQNQKKKKKKLQKSTSLKYFNRKTLSYEMNLLIDASEWSDDEDFQCTRIKRK